MQLPGVGRKVRISGMLSLWSYMRPVDMAVEVLIV